MEEAKLDRLLDKVDDMSERLTRHEVLVEGIGQDIASLDKRLELYENRVSQLETNSFTAVGAVKVIGFLITAGIAIWGVLK